MPSEAELAGGPWDRPDCARRRAVLAETLHALESPTARHRFLERAARNVARWCAESGERPGFVRLEVERGDWGAVAHAYTRRFGRVFAVLNMANAYTPGGAYAEGAPAQEENMFRRTDCHFSIDSESLDESEHYPPEMSAQLNAKEGRVHLDTTSKRVCLRGPEDRGAADLGYEWLAEDEIFPFFELRAAARDYRDGARFDEPDARRRIAAQLDTLRAAGLRHAVLSAFGCGAFRNPAARIARLYREELDARGSDFDCVVFAIYDPGYGPDNFGPFEHALNP